MNWLLKTIRNFFDGDTNGYECDQRVFKRIEELKNGL